jgi:hypothetical protein
MDADLFDATRDHVWAVDVTVAYTTYVVAETLAEAERIAEEAADEDRRLGAGSDTYRGRELTGPVADDGDIVAWGHSLWGGQQVTVNEAVELLAGNAPVRDTQTLLMPFIDEPPPLYPPRIEDYLAAGRCTR